MYAAFIWIFCFFLNICLILVWVSFIPALLVIFVCRHLLKTESKVKILVNFFRSSWSSFPRPSRSRHFVKSSRSCYFVKSSWSSPFVKSSWSGPFVKSSWSSHYVKYSWSDHEQLDCHLFIFRLNIVVYFEL